MYLRQINIWKQYDPSKSQWVPIIPKDTLENILQDLDAQWAIWKSRPNWKEDTTAKVLSETSERVGDQCRVCFIASDGRHRLQIGGQEWKEVRQETVERNVEVYIVIKDASKGADAAVIVFDNGPGMTETNVQGIVHWIYLCPRTFLLVLFFRCACILIVRPPVLILCHVQYVYSNC